MKSDGGPAPGTLLGMAEEAAKPDTPLLLHGKRAAVITASDRCAAGTQTDLSGPSLVRLLTTAGADVVSAAVIPDHPSLLAGAIRQAAGDADLVLTTGGTGLAARDVTPEATLAVCERLVPGLAELIRAEGARQTPFAFLGRGVAGVCGSALVINLPGSPAGAESSFATVLPLLPHALDLLAGKTAH